MSAVACFLAAVTKGEHNLMEPAIFALAVMFGPHNYSFSDTVRDLLEHRAGLLVHDRDEIYSSLKGLLDKPGLIADMDGRARQLIINKRGATGQNFALLEKYLPSGINYVAAESVCLDQSNQQNVKAN